MLAIDETTDNVKPEEFLRLVLTGALVHVSSGPSETERRRPINSLHIDISLHDINLYNQLSNIDVYDFPVILYKSKRGKEFNSKLELVQKVCKIHHEVLIYCSLVKPYCLSSPYLQISTFKLN